MSNKDSREDIRSLSTREQCRTRLPIWFGSRDNYLHGLREVLANASDEISNNFDEGVISVELEDDCQTISVFDSGRGIPIGGETDGIPNYELLFLTLFSGTNYDNIENGKVTTGINGVGTCVLCHSSSIFHVSSFKNHRRDTVNFQDGGNLVLVEDGYSEIEHGTYIRFRLDEEVYTNITYNSQDIKKILKALAGVNNKLTIQFKHKDTTEEYHYDTLEDYLIDNTEKTSDKIYSFSEKTYTDESEFNTISCAWNISTEPFQNTFLNYTNLTEQGAIYDGFINGMRRVFNKESKTKFTALDIEMSFGMVVSVLSNNAEFTNQTKFSTAKQLYRKLTSDYIISNMEVFKAENPQEFDKILKHLQQINVFNTRNEKSIKNIKKKLSERNQGIFNKIPNLTEAQSKDTSKNILCICEGKSSLGSVLSGRRDVHAIFPIRGKILNCLKAGNDRIFNSDIIVGLIQALGCGVTVKSNNKEIMKFDENNLRYSKVYIMVDSDYDGIGSILPLLLTVFYKLMPELIYQGRIYICETPKYEIICNDGEEFYAINDEELEELTKIINKKYTLHYIKGLAELDSKTIAMCLAEDYKNVKQLIMEDVEESIKSLELWMGDKIEPRKEYIMDNFDKVELM